MILTSQNLENPIAKLLKNGTVAGYARSALDIYVYIEREHSVPNHVNMHVAPPYLDNHHAALWRLKIIYIF